jgi:glycosyltransferase involved in cell wall biosynthesis
MLSIVVPIHNEEATILPLYDQLTGVLDSLARPYEVIFVDDASTDRSFELLANLAETDARLMVVRLRRNFGQTAALSAGFDRAKGEVVISLDGDLQHDPLVRRRHHARAAGGAERRGRQALLQPGCGGHHLRGRQRRHPGGIQRRRAARAAAVKQLPGSAPPAPGVREIGRAHV